MKKIAILLFLIVSISTLLSTTTITETPIDNGTVTIGAGSTTTITLPIQLMNADSCAYQLEVDKLDVSGTITYEYITNGSKTNNLALSSLTPVLTLDSSQSAAFGQPIPASAGASRVRGYLYITNLNAGSQSVIYNVNFIKTQK